MFFSQQNSRKQFTNTYFVLLIYVCLYYGKPTNSQFVIPADSGSSERLEACYTPTGRKSFCVPLNRCNQLTKLITNQKRPLPVDVAKYIKESFSCVHVKDTVCCPFASISNPTPESRPSIRDKDETCSVQGAGTGTCAVYFQCDPLLQLLSNLRQPFPPEISRLMQGSILCGRENIGGLNLPKVCCPTEAVKKTDKERFAVHANRGVLAPSCPIDFLGRIVGGNETEIGAYPWLALLGYTAGSGGSPQWKCGGALIGDQHVLTAAHCVTGLPGSFQLSKIRLGEHTISNDGRDCPIGDTNLNHCSDGVQDFDIEKIIYHPSYNSPNIFQNDIAIVKLKGKVVKKNGKDWSKNAYVKPICLPYDDNVKEDYHLDSEGKTLETWVAGWGATDPRGRHTADRLQHINLKVFDGEKCRDTYKKRGGSLSGESQLCSGGEQNRDSCVGDSGSALMAEDFEPDDNSGFRKWRLIGVVSFGPRVCGTENVPGVYSRVRHYIDWILENVGS